MTLTRSREPAVAPADTPEGSRETTPAAAARRLGFWAAVATAVLAIAWEVAMVVQIVLVPPALWTGAAQYAARFRPVEMLNLVPALALAPAFVVLMICVHYAAPRTRPVRSAAGVAFAVIYAVMASVNYLIQLGAVRTSVHAGETEGLALFPMARPHSIFWALASSYGYQALALLFAAPVFGALSGVVASARHTWIRRIFLGIGVTAPLQIVLALVDIPLVIAGAVLLLWVVGIPAAAILLALEFRSRRTIFHP